MEKAIKKSNKKRIYYLDLLRAIGCLLIILSHSCAYFSSHNIGSINYWLGTTLSSLSKVGVPIFIMISGSLFLSEDYNYSHWKLIKHIIKMILFFVFWSFFYVLLFPIIVPIYINHTNITFKSIIGNFIVGCYHLWFIYLIIGLYLVTPLLRLWVKREIM